MQTASKLFLTIEGALGLKWPDHPDEGAISKRNPSCEIHYVLSERTGRLITRQHCGGGSCPVWHESFALSLRGDLTHASLLFVVRDCVRTSGTAPACAGFAQLTLPQLLHELENSMHASNAIEPASIVLPLLDTWSVNTGRLRLRIRLVLHALEVRVIAAAVPASASRALEAPPCVTSVAELDQEKARKRAEKERSQLYNDSADVSEGSDDDSVVRNDDPSAWCADGLMPSDSDSQYQSEIEGSEGDELEPDELKAYHNMRTRARDRARARAKQSERVRVQRSRVPLRATFSAVGTHAGQHFCSCATSSRAVMLTPSPVVPPAPKVQEAKVSKATRRSKFYNEKRQREAKAAAALRDSELRRRDTEARTLGPTGGLAVGERVLVWDEIEGCAPPPETAGVPLLCCNGEASVGAGGTGQTCTFTSVKAGQGSSGTTSAQSPIANNASNSFARRADTLCNDNASEMIANMIRCAQSAFDAIVVANAHARAVLRGRERAEAEDNADEGHAEEIGVDEQKGDDSGADAEEYKDTHGSDTSWDEDIWGGILMPRGERMLLSLGAGLWGGSEGGGRADALEMRLWTETEQHLDDSKASNRNMYDRSASAESKEIDTTNRRLSFSQAVHYASQLQSQAKPRAGPPPPLPGHEIGRARIPLDLVQGSSDWRHSTIRVCWLTSPPENGPCNTKDTVIHEHAHASQSQLHSLAEEKHSMHDHQSSLLRDRAHSSLRSCREGEIRFRARRSRVCVGCDVRALQPRPRHLPPALNVLSSSACIQASAESEARARALFNDLIQTHAIDQQQQRSLNRGVQEGNDLSTLSIDEPLAGNGTDEVPTLPVSLLPELLCELGIGQDAPATIATIERHFMPAIAAHQERPPPSSASTVAAATCAAARKAEHAKRENAPSLQITWDEFVGWHNLAVDEARSGAWEQYFDVDSASFIFYSRISGECQHRFPRDFVGCLGSDAARYRQQLLRYGSVEDVRCVAAAEAKELQQSEEECERSKSAQEGKCCDDKKMNDAEEQEEDESQEKDHRWGVAEEEKEDTTGPISPWMSALDSNADSTGTERPYFFHRITHRTCPLWHPPQEIGLIGCSNASDQAPEALHDKMEDMRSSKADESDAPGLTAYLTAAFEAIDVEESGDIDARVMWPMVRRLGLGLCRTEVAALRARGSFRATGSIDWSEFVMLAPDLLRGLVLQQRSNLPSIADWCCFPHPGRLSVLLDEDADGEGGTPGDDLPHIWYNKRTGVSQWSPPL